MMFLRLAWRNVLRNTRRSVITVAAIAIGLAALIFMWGFIDGINDQMIENSTRYLAGDVQVHRTGHYEQQTLELLLTDTDGVASQVKAMPEVSALTLRLEGSAIVSAGEKSRGAVVIGVEPEREKKVTTLWQTIKRGTYLPANDARSILIGRKTAEALDVGPGSELVLVTQAADGSIGAGRYRVRGIFDTRMDMLDGVYVFLPLAAAQELFAAGTSVTAVVARLHDRQASTGVVARLGKALGSSTEVLGWQRLLPSVVQSVAFHEVTGRIVLLVLFVVVAVGITNTVLMAVMERTREFGVMMALGTSQGRLIWLVFYEAFLLGILGLVVGCVLGVSVTRYFATRGIDLGQYVRAMETMQGLTGIVYPLPRFDRTLIVSALVFVTAVVASIYPAWKAASLQPIEAIRGIRRAIHSPRWRRNERITGGRPTLPVFMKIAARGIARNTRRTLLTVSATAFGLAAFLFLSGFVEGYFAQLVDNSTGYITADLQVQHQRFRQEMAPEFSLRNWQPLLDQIRDAPLVRSAAPRVQTQALISSPLQSQNFLLYGIDPALEQEVTFIHRAVKSGNALEPNDDRDIVLGRRLAERLGVRLGEKVVVMAQAANGELGSAAFRLRGVFETQSEAFDGSLGFITLRAAQSLLSLGDEVSAIAVRLGDRDRLEQAVALLEPRLAGTPYVILSWRELLVEVAQMIEYVKVNVRFIIAVVFAVVAMGIMNTLLMSVMERTREFGIMMALGTPPFSIITLVIYESAVLAAIGIVVGYGLGAALVGYLGEVGVDLSRYAKAIQTIPGLTGVIYPRFAMAHVWLPTIVLLLISILSALYPAWRAARLDPVRAIRHA